MPFISLKKDKYFLLITLLLHAIWFVAAVFVWQRPYSFDSVEYIQLAENMKHGLYYSGNAVLPVKAHFVTLRPPVYSLFILFCWAIGGYNTWFILLLQNLLSVASCFLVRNIFTRIAPQTNRQWIYWFFIAVYPMQMMFANMIFCDILFQFFLMAYFHQLIVYLQEQGHKRIWYMSLWLVLGVFTKPILYPFLLLHALFTLIYCVRNRKAQLLAAGIVPLLLLTSYGLWNQKRTGLFHISSVQSYNLLEYNVSEFYKYKYGQEQANEKMQVIFKELDQAKSFKERYNLSATIATRKIREDWLSYSFFHGLKSLQLFFDPNKLEFDIFSRHFHYVNNYSTNFYTSLQQEGVKGAWRYLKSYPYLPLILITPLFGFFRLLGWLIFIGDKRNNVLIRIAVAVFVLYFAGITGPVANARYFLPILLITSACSWISYTRLWDRLKRKNN